MHIIIVGCGRVGSALAHTLSQLGHNISIIDKNSAAFRRLDESFNGQKIVGIGFDKATLHLAGITSSSAVVSVTSGDNSNILTARVAREMFGAERVVARIYDPRRASVYERLGITTVATVAWTENRILRTIIPNTSTAEWTDPTSRFHIVERRIQAANAGSAISDVPGRVILLSRYGHASVPERNDLLQQDDVIHILATSEEISDFDSILTAERAHHS